MRRGFCDNATCVSSGALVVPSERTKRFLSASRNWHRGHMMQHVVIRSISVTDVVNTRPRVPCLAIARPNDSFCSFNFTLIWIFDKTGRVHERNPMFPLAL